MFSFVFRKQPNTVKTIWIQTKLFLYQRVTIKCTRNPLAFADNLEVRGVFLGISKTFDRVWHEDLLYNLQKNGILGELITLITDFLELLKRWGDIKAGVYQGSTLGPLLSLIYINDFPNSLNSNVKKLFADKMSLISVVHNITDSADLLNSDLY